METNMVERDGQKEGNPNCLCSPAVNTLIPGKAAIQAMVRLQVSEAFSDLMGLIAPVAAPV